jgi:hypothetical protein
MGKVLASNSPEVYGWKVVLADLARERGDLERANDLLDDACDWAQSRDATEYLCWAAVIRAKIVLAEGQQEIFEAEDERLARARDAIEEGLLIARECGYGLHHIDLLTLRARVQLLRGDAEGADGAERDARTALYGLEKVDADADWYAADPFDGDSSENERGVFPPKKSGWPALLAATHPECKYAWGEGDALQVLAEALLLQVYLQHGRDRFSPKKIDTDLELITQACQALDVCRKQRERIRDPKAHETTAWQVQLNSHILISQELKTAVRFGAKRQRELESQAEDTEDETDIEHERDDANQDDRFAARTVAGIAKEIGWDRSLKQLYKYLQAIQEDDDLSARAKKKGLTMDGGIHALEKDYSSGLTEWLHENVKPKR